MAFTHAKLIVVYICFPLFGLQPTVPRFILHPPLGGRAVSRTQSLVGLTLLSNRGCSNNGFSAFKKDYARKDDKKTTGLNSIV